MKHKFSFSAFAAAVMAVSVCVSSLSAYASSGSLAGYYSWDYDGETMVCTSLYEPAYTMTFNGSTCTIDGTVIYSMESSYSDLNDIFSADNTEFISWYLGLELDELNFSDNVTSISFKNSITPSTDITKVTLGSSLKNITNQTFSVFPKLNDVIILSMDVNLNDSGIGFDSDSNPVENMTIRGYDGSTAQTYAEANGFNFVVIPSDDSNGSGNSESESPAFDISLGDADKNGTVDALDASLVLTAYAQTATGNPSGLDDEQTAVSDVNGDGNIDALDASAILGYYAYTATGGKNSIEDFLSKN